jgi:hypothetical protein
MTEHELIASAMGVCLVFAPINAFFYAKWAWQELKWFIFLYLGVTFIKIDQFAKAQGLEEWIIYDYSEIRLSKIKVLKAVVWHSFLLIFYLFFTFWFAILFYESARWIFFNIKTAFEMIF